MAMKEVPDTLMIVSYVSQYHEVFKNETPGIYLCKETSGHGSLVGVLENCWSITCIARTDFLNASHYNETTVPYLLE